jgi:hypothetical protein
VTRGKKAGADQDPSPQLTCAYAFLRGLRTAERQPAHDHEPGEGFEAEGLSGENPINTGSVTTVTIMTMKYGIFPMGGCDITVPGYRRTFRKAEQGSKED